MRLGIRECLGVHFLFDLINLSHIFSSKKSCTLVEGPFGRIFEQNLVHSLLVHDEGDIQNNVSLEVLIWLPVVSPFHLGDNLLLVLFSSIKATDSRSLESVSAIRSRESSRESVNNPSAFWSSFISKNTAEPLSSSSFDSHKSRTYPVESSLASADRSLSLVEWHPTKP